MKNTILGAAALLLISSPAFAATETECATLWRQADLNEDNMLSITESERYLAMMRLADKAIAADSMLSEPMFKENCMADVFAIAVIDEGAPLEGANSFTETQAKDRVIAAGMTAPSVLTKDNKGIWRGTATQNGMTMTIAVDFKGNVVAN